MTVFRHISGHTFIMQILDSQLRCIDSYLDIQSSLLLSEDITLWIMSEEVHCR